MNGEIGFNIDFLRRCEGYKEYVGSLGQGFYGNDLYMTNKDGERLIIYGENDWGYLAIQIVKPILDEYDALFNLIERDINKDDKICAAILGKKQWRIFDITRKIRYNNALPEWDNICGIKVLSDSDENNVDGVTYLYKKILRDDIPF